MDNGQWTVKYGKLKIISKKYKMDNWNRFLKKTGKMLISYRIILSLQCTQITKKEATKFTSKEKELHEKHWRIVWQSCTLSQKYDGKTYDGKMSYGKHYNGKMSWE